MQHARINCAGLIDEFSCGVDGVDEVTIDGKWVRLIDHQIGGIAFEWCECKSAWFDESFEATWRGNANMIARVAESKPEGNVWSHIAACAAGKKGDGFHKQYFALSGAFLVYRFHK